MLLYLNFKRVSAEANHWCLNAKMLLQKGFFSELTDPSLVITKSSVCLEAGSSYYIANINKSFKAGVIICKQASMEAIMMFGNVHVFNFYLLILSIYLFAYGATTLNDQNNKN